MKLLIIRPEPGAGASAARAAAQGFEPVVLPFFEIQPRNWEAPDPTHFDALLVTSANAIRHAGSGLGKLTTLPFHAVGERSAAAAMAAGLAPASTGTSDARETIAAAKAAGHLRLLWLSGEDRTLIQPATSMTIKPVTVYASRPRALPDDARTIVLDCPLVALHSVRAAIAFAGFAEANGLQRDCFALAAFSKAISDAAGRGWQGVAVAEAPTDQALLSAARVLVTQMAGSAGQEPENQGPANQGPANQGEVH